MQENTNLEQKNINDQAVVAEKEEIFSRPNEIWTDGWYVYKKGKIQGPYQARDLPTTLKSEEDSRVLLARKGFTRWYGYDFLKQHFANIDTFKKKIDKQSSNYNSVQKSEGKTKAHSFSYYHFLYRSKLRLGTIENLWLKGSFFWLLTLGFYFKVWFERATIEVLFHLDAKAKVKLSRGTWKVLIPGVHFLKVYQLAKLVVQMERQNNYKKTSPLLASGLAIFPPLAIAYLQSSLNRHWTLHVYQMVGTL